MKVLVLGAGLIGTCTAWYLARQGHEVTVVDRREGAGLETSFANGGQISVCHAEPWANPDAPLKILKWIWRDDSPLLFRLRMDPAQWIWGARFLWECQPGRTRENMRQIVSLALYSRSALQELRAETGIEYDALTRGILHYYTEQDEFDRAVASASVMRDYGLDREVKTTDEALAIEPALTPARDMIVGATYTATDESGDAHKFTRALARMAAERGVRFRYGHTIQAMGTAGDEVVGVMVNGGAGADEKLEADAYVVALGSYTPLLTGPIGVYVPVYPAKGYSASVAVARPDLAPTVSLTDDSAKIVFSRLGDRVRIAGTAELAGYNTDLNAVRCEALVRRSREIFPEALDYGRATFWTGLRPSTPSNVPIIGPTRFRNLYLNTGHGTLGWTMACGSGRALADIVSRRKPEVGFRFTQAPR
jgi:D-amino-acid dehydrogenase